METQEKEEIIINHLNTLSSYFDAIQIFVSSSDGSGCFGIGNHFSRYGQASLWVLQSEDEESEDWSEPEDPESYKIIKNHVAQLSEHFDTVQILANKYDKETGSTYFCQLGQGNFFARYGHVNLWVTNNEENNT